MFRNNNFSKNSPSKEYSSYCGYPDLLRHPLKIPEKMKSEIEQWFKSADQNNSGQINAKELQCALINAQGKNYSDAACNLMISIFDQDKNGSINLEEFQMIYSYINHWMGIFKTYDTNQTGFIEEVELFQILSQMGFHFTSDFIRFLIAKSDKKNHQQMSAEQFIVLCIQMQKFTEAFKNRDQNMKGIITIGFEDFLNIAFNCST